MGLDISAYSKVDFSVVEKDEEEQHDKEVFLREESHFVSQRDGIEPGGYNVLPDSESHRFRAGSYSTYNQWRSKLANMIGTTDREIWENPEKFKEIPFVELINFSDCEGFIGPKTSEKLYKDFIKYDEIASVFSKTEGETIPGWGFKDRYDNWKKAFELASNGGAVCFH